MRSTPFLPIRQRRPLMVFAAVAFTALLSFYVQLLHAAVDRGERLQQQRCAQAQWRVAASSACRG